MPSTDDQITNLDAELDALDDPTTAEVYAHSKDYDADVVAASAARRAGGGGGGGGLPTGWTADSPAPGDLDADGGTIIDADIARSTPSSLVLSSDADTSVLYYAGNATNTEAVVAQDVGGSDYSVGFYNGVSSPLLFWSSDTDIIRANKQVLANNGLKLGDDLDADGCHITDFGHLTPRSKPNIPASPSVQDVVDALLLLGLVTQS